MKSHYGIYGGQYVAETLMPALLDLEKTFEDVLLEPNFWNEFDGILKDYVGRPTPLYFAKNLTEHFKGAEIYLKREDLNHTGAHKINNAIGQALLAKRTQKTTLIAETGAGMHGVATATVAALLRMKCKVFMGEVDIQRQKPNVGRMQVLGAEVVSVSSGSRTLKDAMNEALRYWVAHSEDTFYVIGTVAGPHPYPVMVKHFQSVIGRECKKQCLEKFGALPLEVIACVGGGSNAMGIFSAFLEDLQVRLIGVEAAGQGIETGFHAASICGGKVGVLHGNKSYLLQDEKGQIKETHSVSAGLDYPGVGPEHCYLADTQRATYTTITDQQALEAFELTCRLEGIIPALESSHALAQGFLQAQKYDQKEKIVICLSGRGDKDLNTFLELKK